MLPNQNFAVVIYNAQLCFIIQCKYVYISSFPWLAWNVMWCHLVVWLCGLNLACVKQLLFYFQYHYFCRPSIWTHMWAMLSALCPSGWYVTAQGGLCCKAAGIVIILTFLTFPSMTAMLSWNGQYCFSSLTSALVSSQQFTTYAVSASRWSYAWFACLISSAIMHSGISIHVLTTLMLSFTPFISSSLPSVWLCLDKQSAM